MQLFICNFDLKTFCLQCDDNITYQQLKNLINEKLNLKIDKFQILKEGKYLEHKYPSHIPIQSINIINNSTLYLKEIIFPKIKINLS